MLIIIPTNYLWLKNNRCCPSTVFE